MNWRWSTKGDLAAMEARILKAVQTQGERIMSTVNTSGANLLAAEASLETKIGALGSTLTTAIADLKAEVAAELQAAGVPNATVDAITAKITALGTTVDGLTATAQAADPGAPGAPPTEPPAAA